MKKFFAAMILAGLLTAGCGNQAPAPEPKSEDSKPAFEQAVEPVKDAASNAAADVKDAAANAATDMKDAATDAAADVKESAENMATDMKDAAADVKDKVDQTAADAAGVAREIVDFDIPAIISTSPSIGTIRDEFEMYDVTQFTPTYDDSNRVASMEINTPYIDNDMLASILPSDVQITGFDTNSSTDTRQVNHFTGTSEQLKRTNPASGGKFEAYTNFDKQTGEFLGGKISVVTQ